MIYKFYKLWYTICNTPYLRICKIKVFILKVLIWCFCMKEGIYRIDVVVLSSPYIMTLKESELWHVDTWYPESVFHCNRSAMTYEGSDLIPALRVTLQIFLYVTLALRHTLLWGYCRNTHKEHSPCCSLTCGTMVTSGPPEVWTVVPLLDANTCQPPIDDAWASGVIITLGWSNMNNVVLRCRSSSVLCEGKALKFLSLTWKGAIK